MQVSTSLSYVIMMAMLVVGSAASAATDIRVRERVVMESSVVRLGDVAEIASDDSDQAKRLAALPLMPAPTAKSTRFLRQREIEDLLAAHGVDLRVLTIGGAEHVTIARSRVTPPNREDASGTVAGMKMNRHVAVLAGHVDPQAANNVDRADSAVLSEDVRSTIASYLDKKTGNDGDWKVTCEVAGRHLALLETATSRPACGGGSAPWTGRQRFVISFATAQGPMQFPVYAEVTPPSVPVVVALRTLGRGEVITAADLELQDVDHVPKPSDRRVAVQSIESLIGMEARQQIQVGTIVFTNQVQSPVLVKRGELITVSSQSSGIRVRTTARARQDASQGELVQVESLETKERFDARVVGPRHAAIVAITLPATSEPAQPIETARR